MPDLDQMLVRIVEVERRTGPTRTHFFARPLHIAQRMEGIAELNLALANPLEHGVELDS